MAPLLHRPRVECRAWDPKRDLALLKIIAIEHPLPTPGELVPTFISVPLPPRSPTPKSPIICIGQPGRDDLESSGNRRTKYNLVEISEGQLRGVLSGVDPHDNSEIGTLKHDAWTLLGAFGGAVVEEGRWGAGGFAFELG